MAVWDIFRRRSADFTPEVSDVLLRALLEGETITREKVLTLPVVSGAVELICNSIASMPVRLFRYKQDKVEEVDDDPRTHMLNADTGDTLDGFQLKKAMVEDYLLGKGGYCFIQRRRNDVTGLFYVKENEIQISINDDPIHKRYVIQVDGRTYDPWQFVKLLRNTKDGASGTGLTVQLSKLFETAYQTLIYQLGLVKSGGNKRGFIKSDKRLTQEAVDALKNAWQRMYANNTESVVVLNEGLQFQEASNSSVEMQLNESKRTMADEINGLFHIGTDFDTTFKLAIYPIVKAFETALNRDLLLEKEKRKGYFFEFDVKEIIKASIKERYEAYRLAKETGFMTINEIRQAENMDYIDGMDVINVGLGAVLYDADTQTYFTPNTGETQTIETEVVEE